MPDIPQQLPGKHEALMVVVTYYVEFDEITMFSFRVLSSLAIPRVLHPQDDFVHYSKTSYRISASKREGKVFERG